MPRSAPSVPLIDINQAAERLGVTPRFVRRLVDERRIAFHKIGKYVRFDPADVDRYIVRSRVEPGRR
jgi:excisionase family DNA binding protein